MTSLPTRKERARHTVTYAKKSVTYIHICIRIHAAGTATEGTIPGEKLQP